MDLDFTTLDRNSKLQDETIEALKNLSDQGVKFMFASGRVASSVEYFMEKTGFDNPILACNGAFVKLNREKVLVEKALDEDILEALVTYAIDKDFYFHFYDPDTFYSNRFDESENGYILLDNEIGYNLQCNLNISKDPIKMLQNMGSKAYKFQIFSDASSERKVLEEAERDIREMGFMDRIDLTKSASRNLEVMAKGVNKWEGIKAVGDFLGIGPEEIATIGDHENDVEMIKKAGLGMAVENAVSNAKEACDFVMPNHYDFAVVRACEKILELNRNV